MKMAYISAEETKVIRDELKQVFPTTEGWKFSVRRDGGTAIRVNVMRSPIMSGTRQVNQYHLDDDDEVMKLINKIVTREWWDKSDVMTDYFSTAFYYTIAVGKWNQDCVQTTNAWNFDTSKKRFDANTLVTTLKTA